MSGLRRSLLLVREKSVTVDGGGGEVDELAVGDA
jgi:hypothetical protein